MTYPDRDPRPTDRPTEIAPRPGVPHQQHVPPQEVAYQREEVVERGDGRVRGVRVACAVIDVLCWLFAVVLAIHIFLVIGGANPANGFARMIESWSAGVSLGLRDLFTPASAGLRTLLNDGLAALLWLLIGAVLTNVITRVALPSGERRVWYRRTVR
ncbi:hypothetical protein ACFFSW_13550 [Saccharothrix longispora]|uniref:RDD family protein n=1 Tax=Saccharothrix longispora TaxID=33920 RepID=A0ABU1Q0K5_9PSEU|nr:hypothetical protein [Saccharothrix longispora]MDR6595679.1 hypothetical protein [Saccharothrix longispora]